MEIIFAYLAGLLTLINPCVLPVLPIVLASSLQAGRFGPALLALGLGTGFVAVGVAVTALGPSVGLYPETVSAAGAVLMLLFGLMLLVPRAAHAFEAVAAGFATRADAGIDGLDRSAPAGQFLGGLLLGAVWSPCIGPTLGGAIALASQGQNLGFAAAVMLAFAAGVGTIVIALGYGARTFMTRILRRLLPLARPTLGVTFIIVGLALLAGLHHRAEAWALQTLPAWLTDFSVRF